jgi:hypothetical protein
MQEWHGGKFFDENDEQFCTFIKAGDFKAKRDDWKFVDEIGTFKYD